MEQADREALAPCGLGSCGRGWKMLSADAVAEWLEQADRKADLALAASQAEGRMIVFADRTLYVKDGRICRYGSLAEAMDAEPGFAGYACVAEDIGSVSAFSGDPVKPMPVSRHLVLDLGGRMVSYAEAPSFMEISANAQTETASGLPDVTIRNGSLFTAVNGRMLVLYHGSLALENAKAEIDCSGHSSGNAAVVRINGSEDPDFIRGASVSIDKDTELIMTSAGLGQGLFMVFSSHFRLHSNKRKQNWTRQDFLDWLESKGLTEEEVMPKVFLDGRCRLTEPASGWRTITSVHAGDFDPIPDFPQLTTGNGADKGIARITVGPHAYLNAGEGIGIYSGTRTELRLEGGTIIGGTGIAMRGGTLVVPPAANPTVIGSGPFRAYVPYHRLVDYQYENPDGSTEHGTIGSDAQTFMNMGHAVVFEANGSGYGAGGVSADIESGSFTSYYNTPFGSYGVGLTSNIVNDAGLAHTYPFNGQNINIRFEKRLSGFVEACEMNRPPIGLEYDYATGRFPDWQQTAPGSLTRSGCQTYRNVPYAAPGEPDLETLIPHESE